ncbi:hypothetical protein [uncultured Paludibaculum sp.]|uniref:hypothetical protein n=1 Tax=uncultured Paludibaculum sp. TaxID=1765020 RepID=UPI002AAA887A|nr:hypothetical protein [uncultured Paludibaculum sp.]
MSESRHDSRHPSPAELLLHLEEPQPRIQNHLRDCPECRTRLAEVAAGDANLAEWRSLHARQAPPPPPLTILRARMRAESSWLSRWRRARPWVRWAPVVAVGAVAACLLLIFDANGIWNPAAVEASELLRHASEQVQKARSSTNPNAPRRYLIRRGGQEIQRFDAAKLRLARLDWNDPLNPDDYAQWRAEQADKRDTITRGDGWVRLSTTVLGGREIESASITLNSQDWHPRTRSVHFRGEDEIEVSVAPAESEVSNAGPQDATAADTSAAVRAPVEGEAAEVPESEILLWEALHVTGADVQGAAQLKRQEGVVCYEVWSDGEARDRVKQAMEAIPDSTECRHAAGVVREKVLEPLSDDEGETPAMGALTQHLGGKERANRYLDDVTRRYVGLLARVMALDRYLRWFTPTRVRGLDAVRRKRVEAIALDDAAMIRNEASEYLRLLSEGLAAAGLNHRPPEGASTARAPTGCFSASATASLAEDLRALQRGFSGLFVTSPENTATVDSTDRARAALARRLAGLCMP